MNDKVEKYQILLDLLKHTDSQISTLLTWNIIIQGGLIAALQLESVKGCTFFQVLLQLLGGTLAVFWIISGIRLKAYTDYYIKRLKQCEKNWTELSDFKVYVEGEKEIKRGLSKVLYLRWIPLLLILVWVVYLLYTLASCIWKWCVSWLCCLC